LNATRGAKPFPRGKIIFREGDPGQELFIVTKGRASAYLKQINGGDIRLATFAPGTVFGELATLDAGPRSASVVADDDVTCYVFSDQQFAVLAKDAPSVAIKLLLGLGGELRKASPRQSDHSPAGNLSLYIQWVPVASSPLRRGLLKCGLDCPGGLWLSFFNDQFHFFTAVLAFKSAHLSR
jgi:CRP-like cAMP-binding protein